MNKTKNITAFSELLTIEPFYDPGFIKAVAGHSANRIMYEPSLTIKINGIF